VRTADCLAVRRSYPRGPGLSNRDGSAKAGARGSAAFGKRDHAGAKRDQVAEQRDDAEDRRDHSFDEAAARRRRRPCDEAGVSHRIAERSSTRHRAAPAG
jgi:hypothetical protein